MSNPQIYDSQLIAMSRFKNIICFDFVNGDRRWVIQRLKTQMDENRQIRVELKQKTRFQNELIRDLRERWHK